ncbi:Lysophospholipase L1 [Flavobacteriaceae bacterium MAR_2010_188]|nr:Lysophospholipase L1 [Flavobacteriaceae bacterium MAR_2010_188]
MYAQDWPNLNRYQEQNTRLMDSLPTDSLTVFMGNSITEGWINQRPEYFQNKGFVNRGIGGQTTPQMLIRFRQDVIDLHPKAVVILAGINDIAGNTGPSTQKMIEDNIQSMCELALQNNIKVYLCSVLPAYDFPWRPGLAPAEKVISLNNFLKDLAQEKALVYVDYHSEMVDEKGGLKANLGDDGVHPNAEGYKIMERILNNTLLD